MGNMRSILRKLSIVDFLILSFLGIVVLFYLVAFNHTPYRILTPAILALLSGFLVLMIHLKSKNKPGKFQQAANLIYPVILSFALFETFFTILPYFNSNRWDELMARIDFRILGVNPTVWFESWIHPLTTDLFYLLYVFYFPMPLFIIIWLYRKKMFKELEHAVFVFLFTYFGAYIIYFLVPVAGPRFFLKDLHTIPLDGIILAEPIRKLIDFFEPNKLDAFPSLHAAIVMTTMLFCFKYHKKMFLVFIPVTVGIYISLIYCRYHYFIDMVAGLAWSVFAFLVGSVLYARFSHKYDAHFSREERRKYERPDRGIQN
jgi:membrane-associated phospholipid phosphatase